MALKQPVQSLGGLFLLWLLKTRESLLLPHVETDKVSQNT